MSDQMAAPRRPRIRPAALTAEQRLADQWAEDCINNRLTHAREVAGKWGTTVTAITGLFGVGTIIEGADIARSLKEPWTVYFGLLAVAGLVAAGFAIWFAAEAERSPIVEIPPDVVGRATLQKTLTETVFNNLQKSRRALAAAAVLLVLAFAVGWYAPAIPASDTGSTAPVAQSTR